MKSTVKKPRVSPRAMVRMQFEQFEKLIRNLIVADKVYENGEDGSRAALRAAVQDRGNYLIERVAESKEVCMAMAADADPQKSLMFLITARQLDTDRTVEKLVRGDDQEKAEEFFLTYLANEELLSGPIRLATIQIPPEDAVTDGVLEWEPFRLGARDITIPDIEAVEEPGF